MRHVVLLGDSIFDNGIYVPGHPAVIEQLRDKLPEAWSATLLARDGDVTGDVAQQIEDLPEDATDLVISAGGNDALGHSHLLDKVDSLVELPEVLAEVLPSFEHAYAAMLEEVLALGRSTTVCTIYDRCPFPQAEWRERVPIALEAFNNYILDMAAARDVSAIELRDICTDTNDYSTVSPIEPSHIGGEKISRAILEHLVHRET